MDKSAAIAAGLTVGAIMLTQNFTATQSKLIQGGVAVVVAYLVIKYGAPKVAKTV